MSAGSIAGVAVIERRPIGLKIAVAPIAMGCWPITGISSVGVSEAESLATLEAAFDAGVDFYDTAYNYGYDGESERMIGRALGSVRDRIVIASKGGLHWGPDRKQIRDARPETIVRHCEESLQRLGTDRIDLHYLHAPDPNVPMAETAFGFRQLLDAGKIRAAGVSNANVAQMAEFASVCPLAAYQPHYNMLQREIEASQLPWCVAQGVAVVVYWPLLKGLLAGKLARDHQFDPKDGRAKYPMFQGDEWRRNHDFLDRLRPIAAELGVTLSQLVLNWTIHRPGITAALVGAKRPDQIRENAAAMTWRLPPDTVARIDAAIAERGTPASRPAIV